MNSTAIARAFALALVSTTILSSAASAAGLFDSASVAESRSARPSPSTTSALRQRLVRLNVDELARILPAAADQAADRLERARGLTAPVTIELFPGVSVTAERSDVDAPETGGFVWTGKGTGPRSSFVTLVVNEGEVLGHIQTGGKLYSIEPVSGGLHRVIEINQKLIRDDIHVKPPASLLKQKSEAAPAPEDTRAKTEIRVLVAHTAAAQSEVGTATQMQARIDLAIALANTAYVNSGVSIRLRRVGGANRINYADVNSYGANTSNNYTGVLCDLSGFNCGSFGAGWPNNNQTATFNTLRAKRETVAADLVVLMRKRGNACGVAWIGGFNNGNVGIVTAGDESMAFSVVTSTPGGVYNCIEGNTLAHEMGHNMGLNHDRKTHVEIDGNPAAPKSQYNFGYIDQTANFFTIMAYRSSCAGSCTRIQFFSTPLKTDPTSGRAVGIPRGTNGAADAARILNLNRATVGAWR